MKKLIFLFGVVLFMVGCQREPDISDLSSDFVVSTDYDPEVNFASYTTYFLPDSILLISRSPEPRYWKGERAEQLIEVIDELMTERGFTRTDNKEDADLGIQPSYIEDISYFYSYHSPYWWWGYPGYWGPGYWGDWYGWYYPYSVSYSYAIGSHLLELVDLKTGETDSKGRKKLKMIWTSYMQGLLSNSSHYNQRLAVRAINQAFEQSPYIKK